MSKPDTRAEGLLARLRAMDAKAEQLLGRYLPSQRRADQLAAIEQSFGAVAVEATAAERARCAAIARRWMGDELIYEARVTAKAIAEAIEAGELQ